jgi:uncharacterized protein YvpB
MKPTTFKNIIKTSVLAAAIFASQLFAGEREQLKVRPIVQELNQCVPTSASMMLALRGWNYPPRQIKLATKNKPYYGPNTPFNDYTLTTLGELKKGLDILGQKNWRTSAYKPTYSGLQQGLVDIKNSLKMGKPVLIAVGRHAVVVCGFDDDNQLFTIANPTNGSIVTYQYSSMDSVWRSSSGKLVLRGALFMN